MIIELAKTIFFFLLPGYLASSADKKLEKNERLAASAIYSTIMYGVAALALHIIGIDGSQIIISAVFVFSAAVALKKGLTYGFDKKLSAAILIAFAACLCLYEINPQPMIGDTYVHYSVAKSFLGPNWFTSDIFDNYWTRYDNPPLPVLYRPPLQDFLHSLGMLFNSVDYESAVSVNMMFYGLLIVIAHLLYQQLRKGKNSYLAAYIMTANYFLISKSIELEPRIIASFYVLSMIYYSQKGGRFGIYSAASAGLAYMTHYTTLWFIIPTAGYHILKNRSIINLQTVARILVVFILIVSPLLVRNTLLFGNPMYSTSRSVMILDIYEKYLALEPPTFSSYIESLGGGAYGVAKAVAVRCVNIIVTYITPPNKALEYGLGWALKTSIINLVGLLLFICAIAYLKREGKKITSSQIFTTIAFASLIAPLVFGFMKSDGASVDSLSPLTPLIILYGAAFLEGKKKLQTIVITSIILQTVFLSYDRYVQKEDLTEIKWIIQNIPSEKTLMSVEASKINFYTGHTTYVMPYEPKDKIIETVKKHGIDYIIITPTDRKIRNITSQDLMDAGEIIKEIKDVKIIKIK